MRGGCSATAHPRSWDVPPPNCSSPRETPGASGLALLGSDEWSGTAALRHRDGHRVDVTLHAHPSLDRDGRPQGFVVTVGTSSAASERDRRMVEWAFDQASVGLSAHSTASGSWHLNAAAAEEGFLRCVRRVAEEGRPMRYERVVPEPASAPVRRRAWVIELWPVRDPATGEVVGVGTAAFDSSEQHAARERQALLQEAGACVGTTLNVTRTAQELADLAVPRLADTYLGLIAADTTLTLPFTVIVLRPVLRGVPPELEEAAQIDGCGLPGVLLGWPCR